jgi:hypothetical protein
MSGRPSRKDAPWTMGKVRELFDDQVARDPRIMKWIDSLSERLIDETDHPEWGETDDQRAGLALLAGAAVLVEMERFVRNLGDDFVKEARAHGATWDDVAVTTGYSNGVSASRHYTQEQRKRAAEIEKRRRRKQKAATSSPADS